MLPSPLHWIEMPQSWNLATDNALSITAEARTDWFIDPETGVVTRSAPALVLPVQGPYVLRALAAAEHAATYDAAVLFVYVADDVWAKLCLELSPQGQVTVVSVVTKGVSDDCNSVLVSGNSAYLRVAKLDRAYAFHYSTDGQWWSLIRYFTLGDDPNAQVGFIAQSPTGEGCTATFHDITFTPGKLADVRSGQ